MSDSLFPDRKDGERWPRLSLTLTGPRERAKCQCCGGRGTTIWSEHDDKDQPGTDYVILCEACGDRLIDPHPRLYARTAKNAPLPGVMSICDWCIHRTGLSCDQEAPIKIGIADPHRAHVDGQDPKTGRRRGWTVTVWPEPATTCDKRQEGTAAQ